MNVSRRIGLAALGVVWSGSAIAQGHPFSAEQFYRDLEPEVRANLKDGWEKAEVETKRRAAAGLPHMTDGTKGIVDDTLKLLVYNAAVRKTLCFEQAMKLGENKETTAQIVKSCLDRTSNDFAKYNKIIDYINSMPPAKSARCEMKARDYENEIRFPAFDFLRDAKENAPRLFDFKAFSDCLLAD